MRARRLRVVVLVAVLAFSLALAGCLGAPQQEAADLADAPAAPAPQTPPEDAAEADQEEALRAAQAEYDEMVREAQQEAEENPAPVYEGPPVANLSILGADGVPLNSTIGTAPYVVGLLIEGKISGNAHGYWTLRATGSPRVIAEGTEFPTTMELTLLAPGKHVLRLQMNDGRFGAIDDVTIHVQAPPPPPSILIEDKVTGVWTPAFGYLPGLHTHDFRLDVPVAQIRVNLTGDVTAIDLDLELIAPDGTVAGRHTGFNEPTGTLFPAQEQPIVVTDPDLTYQMGEWILRVKPSAAASGDYALHITFET